MLSVFGPLQRRAATCGSQDANHSELLRQILQSGKDLRAQVQDLEAKTEALQDWQEATTAIVKATSATVQAIEGKMVDMKAGLNHLQQASSQSQSELQTLRRNSGNQNEHSAHITVAMWRQRIVVERRPYLTTVEELLAELSRPGFIAEVQPLLVVLLKHRAGYKKAHPPAGAGEGGVVVVLRTLLQKACNKSKKPPPTALLAALTKLKQPLPDVVDFAAESKLWTEVLLASLGLLSGWAVAFTSMMQQYSAGAAQLDDAALKEWLVQPSRQPFQVQPAFVLTVALGGGKLMSVLHLDMPIELNLQPANALVLRLRENKSSDTGSVKRLEVEGIVMVDTRPSPDKWKKYGSSSEGMQLKLDHLRDSTIRVMTQY
ncbi:hypothetical protein ACK3TF_004266 [Chlorella vulgaris]